MKKKEAIAFDWLKRYTGTSPDKYGDWILLTNFQNYVEKFSKKFDVKINGIGGPMTSSINKEDAKIGKEEFFEPLIWIFPLRFFIPSTSILSILQFWKCYIFLIHIFSFSISVGKFTVFCTL